ncbi:MAG: glycosyl transferase, family 2, partial [Tardiphaga sp.]|nr:glycosyl transferase, family 2 [Tardiphaga sp.]
PRTKPKALNCALPFARGSVIAVFDAEDQPDPGQLRAAIEALRTGGSDVACAQASLCIHNVTDSLFTRMFAAEYAGQFDKVLPGLTEMALPLPLGGTSNHFRADALRAVGGWDAWNVTEDADLGLRLARFGYRAVTFASTTREEAPIRFMPWLKQRSRWMKGWMQTWSVHMRAPIRFWRETGWRGLITLNLIIGANIMGALAYPVFLLAIALETARGGDSILDGLLTPLHFAALAGSLLAAVVIGLCGLARRKRLDVGWIMLLTPVYWACLSLATWRALWQLLREPYRWEKTEHGLTTQPARRIARHRNRFRSAAASSGVRFRLNGAMNLPLRSIR